ncbi:MAG: DUF3592 domain-containing protein [Armatimonas sp.]
MPKELIPGIIGLGAGIFGIVIAIVSVMFTFLLIGGLVFWVIQRKNQADAIRAAAQSWPGTLGVITYSQVQVHSSGESTSVNPVIRYSYTIGDQTYQGDCIRAGDKKMRTQRGGSEPYNTVERYPVGSEITVYYDPANPTNCALER